MDLTELLPSLVSLGDRDNVQGMARFGIVSDRILGIGMGDLRRLRRRSEGIISSPSPYGALASTSQGFWRF